ncbi:MAG: rhomboid family intramembrane serine protease [Gammaproteobacteria bacterium]
MLLLAVRFSLHTTDLSAGFEFLQWGALSDLLVIEGEYFRVLSAAWMHANWMHLLSNLMLLSVTLAFMEGGLGRAQSGIILFVSALCASAMSLGFSSAITSVGASGAIYGLLGFAAHRWFFDPNTIPVRYRTMPGWLLGGLVALDLAIGAVYESIALSMHLGGFIAGVALSWLLLRYDVMDRRWLRAVLTGIVLISVTVAVASPVVRNMDPRYPNALARTFLSSPHARLDHVRVGAWWMATLPAANRDDLELAESQLLGAIGEDEAYGPLDTLATISYRLGRFDEAVESERKVLDQMPNGFYATQLARFERAAGAEDDSVRLVNRDERVCVAAPDDSRREIHAIQLQGEEIRSFLRVRGVENGTCFVRPALVHAGRKLITTLADPTDAEPMEVTAWRMERAVLSLP